MTTTDQPTTHSVSRHLVDPEIVPMLEAFGSLDLSAETLPGLGEARWQPPPGTPDPQELVPDVTTTDRFVPGFDGAPDVRVLHFEPAGRISPTGALVWMHGGGYVLGSADGDEILRRRLAHETGAVVVSVDYRLAPETREPGLVHDCYAALSWVHDQAAELGVDRARLAVGGASAGGGLAATLAILARDRHEIPVSFQLLIYPMLDDRTASTVEPHPYAGEFIWTPADNRFGWTSVLGRTPGADDASPYTAAARVDSVAGLPSTFLSVGALDLFLEEDVAYANRLIREGVPTELHVYPGAFHTYDRLPGTWLSHREASAVISSPSPSTPMAQGQESHNSRPELSRVWKSLMLRWRSATDAVIGSSVPVGSGLAGSSDTDANWGRQRGPRGTTAAPIPETWSWQNRTIVRARHRAGGWFRIGRSVFQSLESREGSCRCLCS